MAQIAYLNHEDLTRALVEAALQTREIGFTAAASYEELIIKSEAGSYYHFASLERLDDHAASVSSGAALIGFSPPGGMSSINVQAAIEELLGLVGGGSVVGTGTTGKLAVWVSGSTVGNSSILSEASSKLLFSGDVSANFYRSAAATMKTDGALQVAGLFTALASIAVTGSITIDADVNARLYRYAANTLGIAGQSFFVDLATFDGNINGNKYFTSGISLTWNDASVSLEAALVRPTLTKNTTNTRTFGVIKALITLNAGGSNTNTTVNLIEADTTNVSTTGVTTRLLNLSYGGSQKFYVDSFGSAFSVGGDLTAGRDLVATRYMIAEEVQVGLTNDITAPSAGYMHNSFVAFFQRNLSGTVEHHLLAAKAFLDAGGSNANETVNLIFADTLTFGASTGMTINCIKLCVGGVEKFRVDQNGDAYLRRLISSEASLSNTLVMTVSGGYMDNSSIFTNFASGNTGIGGPNTDAVLWLQAPIGGTADLQFDTSAANPTAEADPKVYFKGTKLIVVYDDSGTARYKYLDLAGTGVTWVHTTSAP